MNKKKLLAIAIPVLTSAMVVVSLAVVSLNANKNLKEYIVTFDSNGGTPIPPEKVYEGYLADRPTDPYKEGYYLLEWTYLDKKWDFDKNIVENDINLKAVWLPIEYTITYKTEGGTLPEQYDTTYTIESDFDLVRPSKGGYVFIGWFDNNGNRIDTITPGRTGNIYITARWTTNFIAISEDESKGLINVYASETNPNEFTVSNSPINNKHHLFKGWYDEDGNLLSTNPKYTLIINPDITNYIYSRYMTDLEENEWNSTHGVTPTLSVNKVIYGLYPQSNVNEPAIIDKLEQLSPTRFNGYYYYNHEYYTKKVARLARDLETHELLSIRQFDNGDEFVEDETYWFKVEPVSWKILKESSNQYNLVSEKLLDVQRYHRNSSTRIIDEKVIYSNNYKYSDIREWLNGSFKSNAFAFNSSPLTIMEVDNSKDTTATPESGFECENTFDYVALLSYKEYDINQGNFSRRVKTTDYVRVAGANYSVALDNLFSGYYWTRSPIESDEADINGTASSRCNMNGTLNSDFVGWGGSCVQPSITINK